MNQNSTSTKRTKTKLPSPSFVKLAMRNMVSKGNKSIMHFSITAFGFIGFIILIAWLGRPNLP